jgi:hypothetical protein
MLVGEEAEYILVRMLVALAAAAQEAYTEELLTESQELTALVGEEEAVVLLEPVRELVVMVVRAL